MRFKILFVPFVLCYAAVFGVSKEEDEIHALDSIIASAERKLSTCKELRALIHSFHTQQDQFHSGEQTKELAIAMVLTASKILHLAQEHELMYLFSPFFVEELNLFAGIAKKKP